MATLISTSVSPRSRRSSWPAWVPAHPMAARHFASRCAVSTDARLSTAARLTPSAFQCSASEACDPDNCPKVFAPVCGNDGVTYDNACHAEREGVKTFKEGICNVRPCPRLFVPVCAYDGMTYSNACQAERRGVRIEYAGVCESLGRNCPRDYSPVCGIDEVTYDNECRLENAGVDKAYAGACIGDLIVHLSAGCSCSRRQPDRQSSTQSAAGQPHPHTPAAADSGWVVHRALLPTSVMGS